MARVNGWPGGFDATQETYDIARGFGGDIMPEHSDNSSDDFDLLYCLHHQHFVISDQHQHVPEY